MTCFDVIEAMKSLMIILFICTLVVDAVQPTVDLDVGSIKGLRTSIGNTTCDAYLSVPFAEPPIGNYRFEKTVPVRSWTGVRDTKIEPLPCASINPRDPAFNETSKDCLYVNVFTPPKEVVCKLKQSFINEFRVLMLVNFLPIVFVIHGDEWCMIGTLERTKLFQGYTISKNRAVNLIRNKIVIVAIQYRLAYFGFASDGSSELPGNLGYWDQKEALEFISRNSASFSGDKNRITVIGHPAG
ncbi:Carboxylic ester hydrolase [Aphelenchoides besseyi]|nr:Carboxylic ester hydrolase [Aphelenchoides besseyi]